MSAQITSATGKAEAAVSTSGLRRGATEDQLDPGGVGPGYTHHVGDHDAQVDDPLERRRQEDAMRGAGHDNPFPIWRRILAAVRRRRSGREVASSYE